MSGKITELDGGVAETSLALTDVMYGGHSPFGTEDDFFTTFGTFITFTGTTLGVPSDGSQDPSANAQTIADSDQLIFLDVSAAPGSEAASVTALNFHNNYLSPKINTAADARIAAATIDDLSGVTTSGWVQGYTLVFDVSGNLVPGAVDNTTTFLDGLTGKAASKQLAVNSGNNGYEWVSPADTSAVDAAATVAVAAAARDVASYTALQALSASQTEGTRAFVAYRTTAGDGGGGTFVWRADDRSADVTADTQKGVWVPPTSDATGASGCWERVVGDYLDPRWFGAVCDAAITAAGSFSGTNAVTGLQAALDYANSYEIGTVKILKSLRLNSQVVIPVGVTLDGGNPERSNNVWRVDDATDPLELNDGVIIYIAHGDDETTAVDRSNCAFTMDSRSAVIHCSFWYPTQDMEASLPTRFPATIAILSTRHGCRVDYNNFGNCYDAFDAWLDHTACSFSHNRGYPLHCCMHVGAQGAEDYINYNNFQPLWAVRGSGLYYDNSCLQFTAEKGIAQNLARQTWTAFTGNVFIGYAYGVIGRYCGTSMTELDFDGQTNGGVFEGDTITGVTSTETAVVLRVVTDGTAGTLVLATGTDSGAFTNDENLQVGGTTVAVANGTQGSQSQTGITNAGAPFQIVFDSCGWDTCVYGCVFDVEDAGIANLLKGITFTNCQFVPSQPTSVMTQTITTGVGVTFYARASDTVADVLIDGCRFWGSDQEAILIKNAVNPRVTQSTYIRDFGATYPFIVTDSAGGRVEPTVEGGTAGSFSNSATVGDMFNVAQTAGNAKKIPFVHSSNGSVDWATLYWDESNTRLGLGKATPLYGVHAQDIGAADIGIIVDGASGPDSWGGGDTGTSTLHLGRYNNGDNCHIRADYSGFASGEITIKAGGADQIVIGASGLVVMANLPTSDPTNAGQLWNNSGVLTVSAG